MNSEEKVISEVLQVIGAAAEDVSSIVALKKGMTNRSFLLSVRDKKYLLRVPGEGTEELINRHQEADIYRLISGKQICDDVLYFNETTGVKLSAYIENSRTCDPKNVSDVVICMDRLRWFHDFNLSVGYEFDLFGSIEFYEHLLNGKKSKYLDYEYTKEKIFSLKPFIERNINRKCLCHIDAVPDNFLIGSDGRHYIIDWEYAGMCDPHIDIAMFCIYSGFNKDKIDSVIDIYFKDKCSSEIRIKIYCYVAASGFLWSNWCEYKRMLGIEFGEYAEMQFQYAREYSLLAEQEILKLNS